MNLKIKYNNQTNLLALRLMGKQWFKLWSGRRLRDLDRACGYFDYYSGARKTKPVV